MTTEWFNSSVQLRWKHPRNQNKVSIPHWFVSAGWRKVYVRSPWLACTVCLGRGGGNERRIGLELYWCPNLQRGPMDLMFAKELFLGLELRP